MHLNDLKQNTPAELVAMAEELGIEGASTLRKQELMFSILKARAELGEEIMGMGTIEVLQDGFGFLRSPDSNYLAGPDDIYVAPNQVRKFGLRTGDTVEGEIRGPKDGERYFALVRLAQVNYDDPEAVRHMKASAGRDMVVGGAALAAHAFEARLIDEFHLFVAPIVVGGGKRSLPNDVRLELELRGERRFGNGMVYLHYRTTT